MRFFDDRTVRLGLFALGLSVGLAVACFDVPEPAETYACQRDSDCAEAGLVCDDGVCCREGAAPLCVGRPLTDGGCPDGTPATLFYEDRDQDGFGDLQRALLRCAPPRSVVAVTRSGDCNDEPEDGGRFFFPGAREQCDSLDHDCDGLPNNGLDGGIFFLDQDSDGYGDRERSATFCVPPPGWVANRDDCAPTEVALHPGAVERCNKRDDDCDGVTDGKPDCGGPALFFKDPGVVVGARHLSTALQGQPSECIKDPSTYPSVAPADKVVGNSWTGSGEQSHVFWVERDGGTWDLWHDQAKLKLAVTFSTDGGSPTRWAGLRQPVLLFCGPGGFLRLVPPEPYLIPPTGTAPFTINQFIPLDPPGQNSPGSDAGWAVGKNSSDPERVLREVKRIEVLVQPAVGTSFKADFLETQFGLP